MAMNPAPTIDARRQNSGERLLFLIGPGGVGKSTLGRLLAPALGRKLIDLDDEFCEHIGPIGDYIRRAGSAAYLSANSALAKSLDLQLTAPAVFVTSSGFLSAENPADVCQANLNLLRSGYAICLLPSLDRDEAARIVVDRQLCRGFGLKREIEERKLRERLPLYCPRGDMLLLAPQIDEGTIGALLGHLHSMVVPPSDRIRYSGNGENPIGEVGEGACIG